MMKMIMQCFLNYLHLVEVTAKTLIYFLCIYIVSVFIMFNLLIHYTD